MKRKIIFLVNPVSGAISKDAVQKKIEAIFEEKKIYFEFLQTNPSGNYEFIKYKIHEEGITDVVVIGGDGSFTRVVEALHAEHVRFGVIPLGSGNGFALAAGISRNLHRAIEVIINGHSQTIDAFAVNQHFSCMLSGLGFDAKVANDFANKAARGLLTYTQQSIINFFKAHPYQFEVVLDNTSFFTEAFFISIANGNQFGNNVKIAPLAILNDGLLDVVIVQKMNKAKLPFAIFKQLRGNNKLQELVEEISQKNVLYFQTSSITIKNLKYAPLHIDGEPMETAEEIKFEILKDCFQLLVPKKNNLLKKIKKPHSVFNS